MGNKQRIDDLETEMNRQIELMRERFDRLRGGFDLLDAGKADKPKSGTIKIETSPGIAAQTVGYLATNVRLTTRQTAIDRAFASLSIAGEKNRDGHTEQAGHARQIALAYLDLAALL